MPLKDFYEQESKANELYAKLTEKYPKGEAVYEDAIIDCVGIDGLHLLKANHKIETCGILEGRKLYAL
jgi:NADPH-dependent curcumin reductase CurA